MRSAVRLDTSAPSRPAFFREANPRFRLAQRTWLALIGQMNAGFRLWARQASGALLCLLLFGCQQPAHSSRTPATPAPTPTGASSIDPRAPLELASAAGNGETYSFSVAACTGSAKAMQCELSAQVLRGGKVVFSLPLPPCWSDQVTRVSASSVPGVGDPLGDSAAWIAWTVGQNEAKQALAARLVRLAPEREGIVLRTVHDGATHDVLLLRQHDEL